MELLFQQIVDGLASGAIYGAFALALVLIYRATRIVNFGQGEMATFSVYIAWQLCEWGVPVWLSFLISAVLSFGLGVAVFRVARVAGQPANRRVARHRFDQGEAGRLRRQFRFCGFGGGLYAIVNAYISPQSFLAAKSIEILIGAIVGGIASISGAFLGAIFVVFVPEWTAEIDPAVGGLVYGLCLIAMMLLAREGLVGLVIKGLGYVKPGRIFRSFFQRSRASVPTTN